MQGFASSALSKAATPFTRGGPGGSVIAGAVRTAVVGGVASELGGGKFANGARTSAFGYLFNESLTHLGRDRVFGSGQIDLENGSRTGAKILTGIVLTPTLIAAPAIMTSGAAIRGGALAVNKFDAFMSSLYSFTRATTDSVIVSGTTLAVSNPRLIEESIDGVSVFIRGTPPPTTFTGQLLGTIMNVRDRLNKAFK